MLACGQKPFLHGMLCAVALTHTQQQKVAVAASDIAQ
jgi:hypothetical protein